MLRQPAHTRKLIYEHIVRKGLEPRVGAQKFIYFPAMEADYCLYLVTDSTPTILGDRDLVDVVTEALKGGVSLVQYRDKVSETADLIRIGRRLHGVCQRYRVPLLINDRVDVCLAVRCEGVHLGQEDMDYASARRILGPYAIIGVTVSSISEAVKAESDFTVNRGPCYLGIGTVFATPTKENTKSIIGPAGVRAILNRMSRNGLSRTPTVAIGGINLSNIQRVLFQSKAPTKALDGVAVVSSIMAAKDTKAAATKLRLFIEGAPATMSPLAPSNNTVETMIRQIPTLVSVLGSKSPLCHNMTNLVVQNFAANVAAAIGASPIMANYGEEASELAGHGGSLVVNMGTVTPEGLSNYAKAVGAYNAARRPILLDPVGAGATSVRRSAVERLMASGYFTVIKGNESEITTVLGGSRTVQKGVDSGTSTTNASEKAQLVKRLAARERNVVLMTGTVDYLSDGERTVSITNGHHFLGAITGSGCTLGTTIAAFLAVHEGDRLLAALAGVLLYEIAAEQAAGRPDVKGPGTFVPAFIDELYLIRKASEVGRNDWIKAAKVEMMEDIGSQ